MEQSPVEAVIIERLDNLKKDNEEFKEDNKREHEKILTQTTKTNGQVADIQRWRYIVTGAIIIMNVFLVPIVIAVVAKYVLKLV